MFNSPARPTSSRRTAARPSSIHSSRAGTPVARTSSPSKAANTSYLDGPSRNGASPSRQTSALAAGASSMARDRSRGSARRRDPYDEISSQADGDEGAMQHQISLPGGTLLKKDGHSAVTVFSELPREVMEALGAADPYADASTGTLDVLTEHGVLVTSRKTYVWSFGNRKGSFTTCYTFSSPTSSGNHVHALPYASLVPRTAGREPGLLLVSVDGSLRFWDSIASSLSGSERYQSLDVALGAAESVINLQRCDPNTFVLATSQGRLFKITIYSSGGRLQANLTPFNQQRGIFGRLFGGGGATTSGFSVGSEGVIAFAPLPALQGQGSRDLYAAGHRVIQKWRLVDSGGEKLIVEQDVGGLLAALVDEESEEDANAADAISLEIIDAAAQSDGGVRLLYSYARQTNKPLYYGVASLALSDQGTFTVVNNDLLEYRALRDPRPYTTPRLILPNGRSAYFVTFVDTVVIGLSAEDGTGTTLQDQIVLKDSVRNRILGHGSEDAEVRSDGSIAAITCLCAQSGTLLIEFDITAAEAFTERLDKPSQRLSALNERLQHKVEPAIFFDKGLANPLSFAISDPSTLQGELPTVVESISSSILNSSSPNLQSFVDLREHLADHLERLVKLAEVIKSNDLWRLVPHRSRCHLSADAELLAAGVDLWAYHNEVVNLIHGAGDIAGGVSTPLGDAIGDVMAGLGLGLGGDAVRMFFRNSLIAISSVFEHLLARLRATEGQTLQTRGGEIAEINRVALTAFQAAFRYKQASGDLYGLENKMSFEAWTCKVTSVQLLESLFIATEGLIRDRTRELGNIVDVDPSTAFGMAENDPTAVQQGAQLELKTQLCELARYTLASYEERISYLASDPALERERSTFTARFRSARPKLIHPLVAVGRSDRAFALAERHRDFRTLTELCLDSNAGHSASHIHRYLRQYGQGFAFELYQYYVEQNRLKELLEQGSEWGDLLLGFLKATDNASISWLHDLALQRYHDASQTLLQEATSEEVLKSKNVLLSLGKLSYVAELTEDQIATEGEQRKIQLIDDQLDLISIHEKLLALFGSVLPSRGAKEVSQQAEHIVAALCQGIAGEEQEAYLAHYRSLAERLLQGQVMSSEDLIDLLTLKDVSTSSSDADEEEQHQDFTTALEICVRGSDLGEAPLRLDLALGCIWRRALLQDDWAGIARTEGMSDEEVAAKVARTTFARVLGDLYAAPHLSQLLLPVEALVEPAPAKEVLLARFDQHTRAQGQGPGQGQGQGQGQGMSPASVEVLYADLERENTRVTELLQGEAGVWILEAARRGSGRGSGRGACWSEGAVQCSATGRARRGYELSRWCVVTLQF